MCNTTASSVDDAVPYDTSDIILLLTNYIRPASWCFDC